MSKVSGCYSPTLIVLYFEKCFVVPNTNTFLGHFYTLLTHLLVISTTNITILLIIVRLGLFNLALTIY